MALPKRKQQPGLGSRQQGMSDTYQPSMPNITQGTANLPSCSQAPGTWYCFGEGETYGQSYNGFVEHGNDIGTPFHTPLFPLFGGTVTDASYQPWGGQVGMRANVPGYAPLIEYLQHLDLIDPSVQVGSVVQPGQNIGISGGQNSGGYHPVPPLYSSGPHTEYGFGANWINGAQNCKFGDPTCNPNSQPMIDAGKAGQLPGTINGNPGPCIPPFCNPFGSFSLNPCQWNLPILNLFCGQFNWQDVLIRAVLIIVGVGLILAGGATLTHATNQSTLQGKPDPMVQQKPKSQNNNQQQQSEEGQPKEASESESSSTSNASEGAEASEAEEAAVAA